MYRVDIEEWNKKKKYKSIKIGENKIWEVTIFKIYLMVT